MLVLLKIKKISKLLTENEPDNLMDNYLTELKYKQATCSYRIFNN
jgi:hypothetical protein